MVAAGTTTPALIGPADVPVTAGMLTVVYAVGAPAAGQSASTLGVVTQQIPLAAAPMAVQTGTSGLLDHDGGIPTWALVGLVAAAAGILGSGAVLIRSRATRVSFAKWGWGSASSSTPGRHRDGSHSQEA